MGFRSGTSQQLQSDVANQLHQDGSIVETFNQSVYPGVFGFSRPVVKTQNLAMNTRAKSRVLGSKLTVTTETDLDAVPYAPKAYYGTDEHASIGARRYLDKIAYIAIQTLSIGSFNQQAGNYNYSRQTYTGNNIPSINI